MFLLPDRLSAVLVACCVLAFASSHSQAQIAFDSQRSSRSIHNGVEYPTRWFGDTDIIRLNLNQLSGGFSSVAITSGNFNTWISETDGPMRLFEADRQANAYANSAVHDNPADIGTAGDYYNESSKREGLMSQSRGVYAQVINEQQELLVRGEAFSTIDSEITHKSITASGALGVDSFMEPRLRDSRTSAEASATAVLEASYEVLEDMHFLLDATLSGTAGLDLSLRVTDLNTLDHVIIETLQPGMQQRIEHCGVLSPGRYRIELAGDLNTLVEAGGTSPAIEGAYDLSFIAHPFDISSRTIPNQIIIDPDSWISREATSVPEPSANVILLGVFSLALLWRRKT